MTFFSYVKLLGRHEAGLPPVVEQIPFDVSKHEQASSEVARMMQERLRQDVKDFAHAQNDGMHARIPSLLDQHIESIVANPHGPQKASTEDELKMLVAELERLRDRDYRQINAALPLISGGHYSLVVTIL